MRVAVMSDIHGYSIALESVLADIGQLVPFDQVGVGGDLCEVGPAPAGVIRRLQGLPFTVLQGNTDFDIALAADGVHESDELDYVLEQIGREGAEWLRRLPRTVRITPPGEQSPDADLLVCHANPHDLNRRLEQDMSDRELREVIAGERAAVIAFGHHHVAYLRELDGLLLVDVSAVGNPKDGDLRCKYGIFEWKGRPRGWEADIRRVPYPLDATREQILASGLPNPERTLARLERASYRR
ncbi:MAG: metallophosphoesterase family protein [Chloroflexota bacterium]